jgi:hypothetical protein
MRVLNLVELTDSKHQGGKMGNPEDTRKDVKKKPTKPIKEKRKEKQEKKKHQ